MSNKTIKTTVTSIEGLVTMGNGSVTAQLINFREKVVIKEKPPSIDQMCTSALSRLNYALNAEADWAVKCLKKDHG